MTLETNAVGRLGEELAVRHLRMTGLEILERNWRATQLRGELDVVARDPRQPGMVIICEVKARRGVESVDDALAAVTPRKQRQLRALAAAFLACAPRGVCQVRFDVVAVSWLASGGEPVITHLADVL